MFEAAFFRQDGVPTDVLDAPRDRVAVEVGQLDAVRSEDGHVTVSHEEEVARVIQDGRHVARHKVFVFAQADHRGRPLADCDDLVEVLGRDDGQSKHAFELADRLAHRILQAGRPAAALFGAGAQPVLVFLDQVRNDFRVRLGREAVSFGLELPAELKIILNDAVVDHDDGPVTVSVRVRVFFGGRAVGRPARVPDAVGAVERVQADDFFEVPQLAFGSADFEHAVSYHRQARRVVAAVLEPLQPFEDDGHHALVPDIADDSGHSARLTIIADGLQRLAGGPPAALLRAVRGVDVDVVAGKVAGPHAGGTFALVEV